MPNAGCVTCRSALGKIWRNGKRSHNRETKKTDGANTPRDADSLQSASDIPSALKIFRRRCSQAAKGIQTSLRDEQVQKLTDAACRLVEAVLLGIHSHIGKVMGPVDAEIRTLRPGRCASDAPQDLVSICVKFTPNPILGEVATRSRVAVSVRVEQELRFTLQAPPSGLRGQPLMLSVEGLNMPALPETGEIRSELRGIFGSQLNARTAYQWWNENKDEKYPLESSKFHRVVESLAEQRGIKLLGQKVMADGFWGYLHTMDLNVACFEFHIEPRLKAGIALLAKLHKPVSEQDAVDRSIVKEITSLMLKTKRTQGERFAPSGMNVGAMLVASEVGQPGAKAEAVTKLLSAAEWWGPGEDGWHRHDHTWNCTDKKDVLQRVVKQQGRIIWRTADHTGRPVSGHAAVAGNGVAAKRRDGEAAPALDVRAVALFFLSSAIALMLYSRFVDRFP